MLETTVPLEDEVGDVIDKAMRRSNLNDETLARLAGVSPARIRDAVDYRPDFSAAELRRLAAVLGLNEVGFCALGCGSYPLPEAAVLPFCVHALRLRHGIGMANAYVLGECGSGQGLLFDTGPGMGALDADWPPAIHELQGVFLTHVEAEHAGGLPDVWKRFGRVPVHGPSGAPLAGYLPIDEGETRRFAALEVTAFSTPGHSAAHNCYHVQATGVRAATGLLISGDLIFAGSVGGAHFCPRQLAANVRRVLEALPPSTVIAPGHGPLTTVGHELRYNPFVL